MTPFKYLGGFVLLTALFYLHQGTVSPKPRGLLLKISIVVTLVLLGLSISMFELKGTGFSDDPEYQVTLKSPAYRLAGAISPADFFAEADKNLNPLKDQNSTP